MSPPDYTKVALGVSAATGVVLVSYFLLKKFGYQESNEPISHPGAQGEHVEGAVFEKITHQVFATQENQPPTALSASIFHAGGEGRKASVDDGDKKSDFGDDSQNQSSFIFFETGEGVGVELPDNGRHHSRKSDRSSDESSYDVIDDERLADTVDVEEAGGEDADLAKEELPSSSQLIEESFLDTSLVVIGEADRSKNEKSGSSFYASAEEHLGESFSEEGSDEKKDDEGISEASLTEENQTVVFAKEGKQAGSKTPVPELEEDFTGHHTVQTPPPSPVSPRKGDMMEAQEKVQTVPITEAVLRAELGTTPSFASTASEQTTDTEDMSREDMTEVLTKCQNSPMAVTQEDINKLVVMLNKNINELHSTVLNCLVRVAAFTQNNANLRASGCPEVMISQVKEACEKVKQGQPDSEVLLNSVCQALTNLCMDPKTQPLLEGAIPSLVDLLVRESTGNVELLFILRPLVNFSMDSAYHRHLSRSVGALYSFLDTASHPVKVLCLKVLVNISLNVDMVPTLLAAKAPVCLLQLLEIPTPNDLILRTVTLLANIHAAIHESQVTAASLPIEDKAESPETMYMALNGLDRVPNLRSKVFRLTRHEDEDVCYQASKLYKYITEPTASS